MTNIDPINVNTQGVGGSYGFLGKKASRENDKGKAEKASIAPEQTPVPADQVLNHMAQSAISVAPRKVDPSKYVDSASADRIAGFMADFEDIVANNLKAISTEFPNMSDSAKQALALSQVNDKIGG